MSNDFSWRTYLHSNNKTGKDKITGLITKLSQRVGMLKRLSSVMPADKFNNVSRGIFNSKPVLSFTFQIFQIFQKMKRFFLSSSNVWSFKIYAFQIFAKKISINFNWWKEKSYDLQITFLFKMNTSLVLEDRWVGITHLSSKKHAYSNCLSSKTNQHKNHISFQNEILKYVFSYLSASKIN